MVFKFYFLKKYIFIPSQRKSHTKIYLFVYGQAFQMKKKKNKQTKIFVMHILGFYNKFIKLIEIYPSTLEG
jgi:hypothetical protein